MTQTNLASRVRELVEFVDSTRWQQALLDESEFWRRLELVNAPSSEQAKGLAALEAAGLRVVLGPKPGTRYLSIPEITIQEKRRRTRKSRPRTAKLPTALPPTPAAPVSDPSAPTMRALSIRQPYVEWILQGIKVEEHRTWRVMPGPLLLHASRTLTEDEYQAAESEDTDLDAVPLGALVGMVDVGGIEGKEGDYAWQLENPRRFAQPIPYKGAAAIMRVPAEVVKTALEQLQNK